MPHYWEFDKISVMAKHCICTHSMLLELCPAQAWTTVVILHGATPEFKSRIFIQTQCEAASLIMLIADNGKRDVL